MIKIRDYKGYIISYDEQTAMPTKFKVADAGGDMLGNYLDEEKAKAAVDRAVKTDFTPMSAILNQSGQYTHGRITSYNLETKEFWFVTDKGDRTKHTTEFGFQPCLDSTDNNATVSQIEGFNAEMRRLQKAVRDAEMRLVRISAEMLAENVR